MVAAARWVNITGYGRRPGDKAAANGSLEIEEVFLFFFFQPPSGTFVTLVCRLTRELDVPGAIVVIFARASAVEFQSKQPRVGEVDLGGVWGGWGCISKRHSTTIATLHIDLLIDLLSGD